MIQRGSADTIPAVCNAILTGTRPLRRRSCRRRGNDRPRTNCETLLFCMPVQNSPLSRAQRFTWKLGMHNLFVAKANIL